MPRIDRTFVYQATDKKNFILILPDDAATPSQLTLHWESTAKTLNLNQSASDLLQIGLIKRTEEFS